VEAFASAHLVVALTMAGTALILLAGDHASRSTRALALCLGAIALALLVGRTIGVPFGRAEALGTRILEMVAILAAIEWGRRIGQTAQSRARRAANGLFRASQILVLVYGGLTLGYIVLFPDRALQPVSGVVAVRALEFAVFAPVLGSGILCAAIAIAMLRFMRIDRAEMARLRALFWAAPFLLAALVVADPLIPVTLTVGLLVFLAGSVRYLVIQARRGTFLGQFLSPEVAQAVRAEGLDRLLRRERRRLSVVACDLRGFTAYARTRDSDGVAGVLERYYAIVGTVAARHGGTVKDHAGDGVLILLGAPLPMADHARRAARLALELMREARSLLAEAAPEVGIGIGIATGSTTVGAIRGAGRLEYVAIGNAVNLAARLCARAEPGEILTDQRTAAELDAAAVRISPRAPEALKGYPEPIPVCALLEPA
jgi:adenylate cyclase